MGRYIDYASIGFTDSQTSYRFIDGTDYFVGSETLFYSDQDCLVRFDEPDSSAVLIKASTWMSFGKATGRIWVTRSAINGTLEVWAEGNTVA